MNEEFSVAVFYYLQELRSKTVENVLEKLPMSYPVFDEIDEEIIIDEGSDQGKLFSSLGPASYQGDILNNPELVWTEDVWNEERERQAEERLRAQGENKGLTAYWKEKYIKDAGRFWHIFYQHNADHFYKDRHYLHIIFPELLTDPSQLTIPPTINNNNNNNNKHTDYTTQPQEVLYLLEVGCGVGNAIWPLLNLNPKLAVIALDFAKAAINLLQAKAQDYPPIELTASTNETVRIPRVQGYVHNIVTDEIPLPTIHSSNRRLIDLVLCMFVLSAISPLHHQAVLTKLYHCLQPGHGKLLIRDYGRYDEAQLRFASNAKLENHFYVRQDGTCSYFFQLDELIAMVKDIGFEVEESQYIRRQYSNRLQKKVRYRVWIHVKLRRPALV